MNAEQFQIIMDSLDGATTKAAVVAVLYVLKGYVVPLTITWILSKLGMVLASKIPASEPENAVLTAKMLGHMEFRPYQVGNKRVEEKLTLLARYGYKRFGYELGHLNEGKVESAKRDYS